MKLIFLFFVLGCSSLYKEKGISRVIEKKEKINLGPSQKSTYFKDRTDHYGLMGLKSTYLGASDLNNDGFCDIISLNGLFSHPEIYLFDPKLKLFRPLEHNAFKDSLEASSVLIYDFNKDGVKDIITYTFNFNNSLSAKNILVFKGVLKKKKIYFEKVQEIELPAKVISSVIPLDFNKDGFLDLFVGSWAKGKEVGNNFLLIGHGLNFKIQNKDLASSTLALATCDYDQDGNIDILEANSSGYKNRLLKGNGKGSFEDNAFQNQFSADFQGVLKTKGGGRTQFTSCFDFQDDGDLDLFLGEMNYAFDSVDWDRSSILVNEKGSFSRVEVYETSMNQESSNFSRAIWKDLDFDGSGDLLVNNLGFAPTSKLLFLNFKEIIAKDLAKENGIDIINPSQTILLDVNNDGKLDILTAQMSTQNSKEGARVYLFENHHSLNGGRVVEIKLHAKHSNKEAIGAYLVIKTNLRKTTLWTELSFGFLTPQTSAKEFFYLKKGEQIKSVSVNWPSKTGLKVYRPPNNSKQLLLYE